MRLRKFISSSLIIGLLFNNTSSLALVLSDDGRYETFEDSNITINDILEEDTVDVEIEGNTMVNVANQKDPVPITKSYTVEGTNHIPLQGEYDGKARPVIEGNTMYYNNDTGELTDTFVDGANLSLVSSFEDQLVTQDMIDSGQEDSKNLGKYKVEYKITGKNKFDGKYINAGFRATSPGASNKVEFSNNWRTYYMECKPSTTYYIKGENAGNRFSVGTSTEISFSNTFYLEDTVSIEDGSYLNERTITTTKDSKYLLVYVTNDGNFIEKPQITITEGSTPTNFEAYKESIKTFYLNSPLLEGDTIEEIDGKAVHVKRADKLIFNGTEMWYQEANFTTDNYTCFTRGMPHLVKVEDDTFISDGFRYNTATYAEDVGMWESYDGGAIRIKVHNSVASSVSEFRQWLSGTPLTVVYRLATPIYETISEESILINSYKDGHLDLDTNITVNKVDFLPTTTNLNYLYPFTEYTVQFESNNTGQIDAISLGNEVLYNNYSVIKGVNRFNITTPSEILSTDLLLDSIGFNLSNLVVTKATNESFNYFDGIQSVGQDDENGHNIEVLSQEKNLLNGKKFALNILNSVENSVINYNDKTITYEAKYIDSINIYPEKFKENTSYTIILKGYNTNESLQTSNLRIRYVDGNFSNIPNFVEGMSKIVTPSNKTISHIEGRYNSSTTTLYYDECMILEGEDLSTESYQSNTLQIPLLEPLRSLPNGVTDRIIKRNGQWVIERNCGELSTDTLYNATWNLHTKDNYSTDHFGAVFNNVNGKIAQGINLYSNVMQSNYWSSQKPYTICTSSTIAFQIGINLEKGAYTANKVKEYIKENNMRIIYELETPTYEPLNISPTVNLFKDTTHISNSSNIPANMKVAVDRTLNRAYEAIEVAKSNPTTENISIARMWINLAGETLVKDEFQEELDSITDIVDLEIEKKSVTANLDVYIKSHNSLSMSLNTNSIVFEDYSGVEDKEMQNAVEISVTSSLPYSLNAYLESPLQNQDKTSTIEACSLNIKENNQTSYQAFQNTTDKIVLNDNADANNDWTTHNIDIKLAKDNAHKTDVYKATIKFEAVQK